MSDLKRRMARGAAWMVAFRFVDRGIGLVGTLILARLLVPGDFGLMAMAMTIIAALELLGAYNFETVLIQNRNAERSHYDTAFTLNLLLALLKALLMALLAHPAAVFYGEPRLEAVMLALAAASVLQGLENIGIVDFQKELQFDREFKLSLYRRLAGFAVTMAAAWWLGNYWALIIGIAAMRTVGVALSFGMHSYRPRLTLQRWRELFGYTKWLLLNNVLIFLNNRGADFVIGRVSGTHALGLYSVSYELANLPTTELVHPIQRAVFPGYSQLASDFVKLRVAFLEVIGLMAVLTMPIGLLIGVLAEPMVMALLGPQWREAAPLIQVLALFGVIRALHGPTGAIYLALGRPRLVALLAFVQLVFALGLMTLWVPAMGALGAAWSLLVGAAAALVVNFWLAFRHLSMAPRELIAAIWRPLLAGVVMAACVGALASGWDTNASSLASWAELLVLSALGVAIYIPTLLMNWALAGKPPGAEAVLIGEIRRRLRRDPADLPSG